MSIYRLNDQLTSEIRSWFNVWELDSKEMNNRYGEFLLKNCYTKTGKPRVRRKDFAMLNMVYYQLKKHIELDKIIFGYWYKDEFYTTNKRQTKFKTTDTLHEVLPRQAFESLKNGLYYKDSLKPYFID